MHAPNDEESNKTDKSLKSKQSSFIFGGQKEKYMYLLVEFSYRQTNYLDEEDFIEDDKILVEAPDDLLKSNFKNFVYENYFNDIFNICKYSNKLGTEELHDFGIDNVTSIELLKKIVSC